MTAGGDVIVVGSINVDFVVRVGHLPAAGETVTGGSFARFFGGKGANQAVAAARLGARVRMVGAVGDDELGSAALADLANEGIDVSGVSVLSGIATGLALIVVDEAGENQIAVASGANDAVSDELVISALASAGPSAGVVAVGFEVGDGAVLAAVRFATARGALLVVNAAPIRPLDAELLGAHPLLVVNELEAAALTAGKGPPAAALGLAAVTGRPAIVTLGEAGAVVAEGGATNRIGAPRVEAVDTTGAGDTVVGALAAELASGTSVLEAARFAVAAASLSVTAAGARAGMPRRGATESLLGGKRE